MERRAAVRFLALAGFFCAMFVVSCAVEEWMFKQLPGFNYMWTVVFFELFVFVAGGGVECFFVRRRTTVAPDPLGSLKGKAAQGPRVGAVDAERPLLHNVFVLYCLAALCLVYGQSTGKFAFNYLNYATGTVLKSAKLLPTMMISACWLRRAIPGVEWAAAVCMVSSCALMSLGDRAVEPSFHPVGLFFSITGSAVQALMGNIQDAALKVHGGSVAEYLFYSNGAALVLTFGVLLVTGELSPAVAYFFGAGGEETDLTPLPATGLGSLFSSVHAFRTALLLLRSVTFFLGGYAYLTMVKEFGIVPATVVAIVRKIVTVLGSFLLFPKPWHVNYAYGVALFVAADVCYLERARRGRPPPAKGQGDVLEPEPDAGEVRRLVAGPTVVGRRARGCDVEAASESEEG